MCNNRTCGHCAPSVVLPAMLQMYMYYEHHIIYVNGREWMLRHASFLLRSRRPRSFSAGTRLLTAQPSDDAASMDHKSRKTIRRKLVGSCCSKLLLQCLSSTSPTPNSLLAICSQQQQHACKYAGKNRHIQAGHL